MTNQHGAFIWYELLTTDAAGAKQFYDRVIGWTIDSAPAPMPGGEAPDMDYRMIRRADGGYAGGMMQLTEGMLSDGARPGWLGYIGVDDVDAMVDAVAGRGGSVVMPAETLEGIGRMALLADPQGALFYVMRGASDDESDVFAEDAPGRCGWNELATPDLDRALHFYAELFGHVVHERNEMDEAGPYCFLDHHHTRIGAAFRSGGGKPAGWTYYLNVPSISAARAAIEAEGGNVTMGPVEVPDGSWILHGTDPQGLSFALVGPGGE